MADFVWRDGQRLTAWMLYCILLLDAEMARLFGVHVIVTSAIRTYAEQERIFRERYVTAGNVNGRHVYDTRIWNGVRWYRISSAGTVAVPGTSNHEIQGSKAAVDLRDTGSDGGIATAGSARSNWLRANAARFGLIASGFGFGEAWHYDIPNIYNTPPTGDDMGTIDATAANKQVIKDAMFEFFDGAGMKGTDGWKFVREGILGQPLQAQSPEGLSLYYTDASRKATTTKATQWPVKFNLGGFIASTNAQIDALRKSGAAVTLTDDQVKVIAADIAEALTPVVSGATPTEVRNIVTSALGTLVLTASTEK